MVAAAGSVLIMAVIALTLLPARPLIPVIAIFMGFMMANSTRMVALNALNSRIPAPAERGRFMSAQSSVQHMAMAIGAGLSAVMLTERSDRGLDGMPRLAMGAIVVSALLPLLLAMVARRLPAAEARI